MTPKDMERVAQIVVQVGEAAANIEHACRSEGVTTNDRKVTLGTFCDRLKADAAIANIRADVIAFSSQFYMPGEEI